MTTPVPTRFSDDELAALDQLVTNGVARSRSDAIRLAVAHLVDVRRRAEIGRVISGSYRSQPQTPGDDAIALANANALTEAEPW